MPTTSWRVSTDVRTGTSAVKWVVGGTASSITDGVSGSGDGKFDQVSIVIGTGAASITDNLFCIGFGFSNEVPANATITAVRLRFTRNASNNNGLIGFAVDGSVRMVIGGGGGSVAREDTTTHWPTVSAAKTYADWSGSDLTTDSVDASAVRSAAFGCYMTAHFNEGSSTGSTLSVLADMVEMQVDYTVPSTGDGNLHYPQSDLGFRAA